MKKASHYFITIICCLFTKSCLCYEIPNVKLELLNNGFSISLTDEPGIKKVLYVVNINDKCPAFMDLQFEPQPDWTTSQSSVLLKDKDKILVSILVDHNGEAYRSSQHIIVGENNNRGTAIKTPTNGGQTKCLQKPIATPVNCKPVLTVIRDLPNICKDQLVFEENFNDSEVDKQKWSFDIRNLLNGKGTEEFAVLDNHGENIFQSEGSLNIKPTFTQANMKTAALDFGSRCTPVANLINECKLKTNFPSVYVPPINSSQIHTRNTFNFKYGRVEIKAKLPKGDWLLPYIMLQNYGTFDKKQIRIAFARGNEQLMSNDMEDIGGHRLYGGVVKDVEEHDIDFKDLYGKEHYGNDFHIYTMTWTKEIISLAVDGVTYGAIRSELNEEFFISLGVSAGGHFEFPDNLLNPEEKPWRNTSPKSIRDFWQSIKDGNISWTQDNQTMQIDYVRVYAV